MMEDWKAGNPVATLKPPRYIRGVVKLTRKETEIGLKTLLIRITQAMYVFLKSEFDRLLREAIRMSRQASGTEICGLLIDTGVHLAFIQTRNASPRVGSFAFSPPEVRRVVAATKVLGQEVVGTFHSHPVGVSAPGTSDIECAVDDSLMFLFDCIGRDGRLWKIRSGRAHPLDFTFFSP